MRKNVRMAYMDDGDLRQPVHLRILIRARIARLQNCCLYSRLSLSRLRLSRITAYLEVKIWPLF